ncbi:KUP/HAK/KT family potassium transporter [Actinomadura verrucosospora]|uniref:Low affinity potassium transporter (Kup family) n=1 Tax=Actinomadura verrucosospora TaxID=46165 RepID=A0A7D3VWT7_ACTVE|nr:KUP/HAK/KT family potassium transporter [Actinomadura verrucosospora]QKG24598.1 low affinity potassium transporter (Kup family) [Actinomadura verrucosospora]
MRTRTDRLAARVPAHLAVTGTFLITTALFLVVARVAWRWATWKPVVAGVVPGGAEIAYFSANLTKITHGGRLPLLIGVTVFTVMKTWERGREIVTDRRTAEEGPLPEFIETLHCDGVQRVPGTAVFPHPTKTTTPLALRANFEHNHVVHEHVVIVSMVSENVSYIPAEEQLSIDDLEYGDDGILHVTVRHGFQDRQDLPAALRRAALLPEAGLCFDPEHDSYFLSRGTLRPTHAPGRQRWRKRLFLVLARNAANPAEYFGLPMRAPWSWAHKSTSDPVHAENYFRAGRAIHLVP